MSHIGIHPCFDGGDLSQSSMTESDGRHNTHKGKIALVIESEPQPGMTVTAVVVSRAVISWYVTSRRSACGLSCQYCLGSKIVEPASVTLTLLRDRTVRERTEKTCRMVRNQGLHSV